VKTGQYIELQFTGAEIIEVRGSAEELYGDGTITLTPREALRLAMELLETLLEEEKKEEETAEGDYDA
jgi:hypothetical protein